MSTKKSNLKRHLKDNHPKQFFELGLDPDEETLDDSGPSPKKMVKISVEIDTNFFTRACVKMVTSGGLPLSVFEKPGICEILAKIQDALKIKLNRNNMPSKVKYTADQFKKRITEDLKNKFVCIKLDSATRKGRSILGVNAQYLKDTKMTVRTLGMIDIKVAQTAENIRQEVHKILAEFHIDLDQVYTITTDNGANFVKAVELLRKDQDNSTQDDGDIALSDDESCSTDDDDDESPVIADWDTDDEEDFEEDDDAETTDEPEEVLISDAILEGVRCAAHTLQLAVYDVIKSTGFKKKMEYVKKIAATLRTKKWRHIFKVHRKSIATLECDTRWSSAYLIVEYFMEHRDFLQTVLKNDFFLRNLLKISQRLSNQFIWLRKNFRVNQ